LVAAFLVHIPFHHETNICETMKRKKANSAGAHCGAASAVAVETTHTRELYFGYKCMNKAMLERHGKTVQDVRNAVDSDVRALATCTRYGTRFLAGVASAHVAG
jgi:hypothetical protein